MSTKREVLTRLSGELDGIISSHGILTDTEIKQLKHEYSLTLEKVVAAIEKFIIPPWRTDDLEQYLTSEGQVCLDLCRKLQHKKHDPVRRQQLMTAARQKIKDPLFLAHVEEVLARMCEVITY